MFIFLDILVKVHGKYLGDKGLCDLRPSHTVPVFVGEVHMVVFAGRVLVFLASYVMGAYVPFYIRIAHRYILAYLADVHSIG